MLRRAALVVLLTACLLALAAPVSQGAGLVRSDSFETYPLGNMVPSNGWLLEGGKLTPQVVSTSVDSVAPYSGSKMASFNWNGPINNYESMYMAMGSQHSNELFLRFWLRFANDWTWSTGVSAGHWIRFYNESPYNDWLDSNAAPGDWVSQVSINGSMCGARYLGIPNTSWHKYEKYINRTTGAVKMWVDDVLQVNLTCSFGSQKFDNWFPMSNWGNDKPDATNHMYFDEFELWSDTGNSSFTGSMSNGDIAVSGAVSPPDVTAVSCAPSSLQAPGTTTCTATLGGGTPTSYAWSAQTCGTPARCTSASTGNPGIFSCTFGGPCTLCLTATNSGGSDIGCASAVSVRYVKPSGFGAN